MTDVWGADEPPAAFSEKPLPPRLARLAQVEATGVPIADCDPYDWAPRVPELPEIAELIATGWHVLSGAPLYCLLPAVWPPALRTWVPDRLPNVSMGSTKETYGCTIYPVDPEWDDADDDTAREAERAGLPAPQRGRIWLLRSPWPRIPVAAVHQIVWAVVQREPHRDEIVAVYETTRQVLTWTEQQALEACPEDTRRLIEEWSSAGRIGEAAGQCIDLALSPSDLTRLTATGLDEATALAWLTSLQAAPDKAVDFIVAWREAGLPGNPPVGAERFSDRDLADVRAWLDDGFDLLAADELQQAGLAQASQWREAGFTAAQMYGLMRADRR